ncbi:MAG: type II toxin-antitoxin system HicA family toxin [Dehalococcoidia bacterium]|nr:type II toxin-antitoxin system HicA family toxin [Dehalococcoidia bacterium]
MSPKLPVVKARDLVRVATKLGFVFDHQKGSHAVYYRGKDNTRAVIPMHTGKDIKAKTLEGILDDMGITPEEFWRLLHE